MPIGRSPGKTVGAILSKDDLLVPQGWSRLDEDHGPANGDLVPVAAKTVLGDKSVLIVGEPGIGKSLTASRIFLALAAQTDTHAPTFVPVFVHLGDIDFEDGHGNPEPEFRSGTPILKRVEGLLGWPSNHVTRWARANKLFLILDGLDEAPGLSTSESRRKSFASLGFKSGKVVTMRRDSYDLFRASPGFAGHFDLVVELKRLPFQRPIRRFVTAYCEEFPPGNPQLIMAMIKKSPELQDLTARPLTLWMVVDVLAEPAVGEDAEILTATALYRGYTQKWLQREADRPGSQLETLDDKRVLVRMAARAMFHSGTALGSGMRSTTEMAVSRELLADAVVSDDAGGLVEGIVARLGIERALDEVCSHTFLVRGGDSRGYRFAHKSFFEYFVALDMWEVTGRENRLRVAEEYFVRPLSDPVVYFFRELLSESRARPNEQEIFCEHMLELLNTNIGMTHDAQTIRQHVGNLLAGVADASTADKLARLVEYEESQFVRRGLIVGLALHQGRTDLLESYVWQLQSELKQGNQEAVSIQIGYSRIYHGDQQWRGVWEDDGTSEVASTVSAQIDRLLNERNRRFNEAIWLLTLFSLRVLIEDGRAVPVLESDSRRKRELLKFLRVPQPGRGPLFEEERLKVLGMLHTVDASNSDRPRIQEI